MKDISVRAVRPEDADAIATIYAPFVTSTAVSLEYEAPDAATIGQRIASTVPNYPWLVAEDAGRVAGYVYASAHHSRCGYRFSADVTAYLSEEYRGRGLGKRLYRILFVLLEKLGYRSLFASITLPNDASIALHRAMGMSDVGIFRNVGFKLGAWHDVACLGLSFAGDASPPALPRPFKSLAPDVVGEILRL